MLMPIKPVCDHRKVRRDNTAVIFIQYCYSVNSGKVDPLPPFQIDPLKNDFKKGLKKACCED